MWAAKACDGIPRWRQAVRVTRSVVEGRRASRDFRPIRRCRRTVVRPVRRHLNPQEKERDDGLWHRRKHGSRDRSPRRRGWQGVDQRAPTPVLAEQATEQEVTGLGPRAKTSTASARSTRTTVGLSCRTGSRIAHWPRSPNRAWHRVLPPTLGLPARKLAETLGLCTAAYPIALLRHSLLPLAMPFCRQQPSDKPRQQAVTRESVTNSDGLRGSIADSWHEIVGLAPLSGQGSKAFDLDCGQVGAIVSRT